jgi:hypothetical protein
MVKWRPLRRQEQDACQEKSSIVISRCIRTPGVWCQEYNLSLNINKTKEMIVDFRKQQRKHPLSTLKGPQWRRWKASSSSEYTSLTN